MRRAQLPVILLAAALFAAVDCHAGEEGKTMSDKTFGEDAAFLKRHTDAIVLSRGQTAIVVVPEYQGRVMTATAGGEQGASSGWINYELVARGVRPRQEVAGKLEEHMYAFGGEERFWMGPEGGQYSIFFAPGKSFEFADWFTPGPIDHEPWQVVSQAEEQVVLTHRFGLRNHSGTEFDLGVRRSVKLLDNKQVGEMLGAEVPSQLELVAYQTINTVTNKGDVAWKPESGLLSIWLLCMFKPSPTTTVFIPYRQGEASELGKIVNADYFGAVPPARLRAEDGVIYFKADGTERGKIGVTARRSLQVAGSYDPAAHRVTLLHCDPPQDRHGYVNSMWEWQDEPYQGDALNSYNDGPVDDSGEQMGPFYELESSSPALALEPGESATHTQTILHCYGDQQRLQQVVDAFAPVALAKVKTALP
jgi:hypothetical protein